MATPAPRVDFEHEYTRGEVAERIIASVLKTAGCKPRGFESHPLRQVRAQEPRIGASTEPSSRSA